MPRKRENGEGALYETTYRGHKVWRAVIDVGLTEDGRRKQRAVMGKDKATVQMKFARMLREREAFGRVLDRSTRFEDAAAAWIEEVAKSARPKTLGGYRSQLKVNVIPALGRKAIADLTPGDIRRMHSAIRAKGSGDSDVLSAHRVAVSVLEWCRRERMIADNVASLMPPRKTKSGKARGSLTREEAKAVLALRDPRWTLSLLTGMRSGEALGLRISELDLDAGRAWVSWEHTEANFRHGCGQPRGKVGIDGRGVFPCGRKIGGRCPDRVLDIAPELEYQLLEGRHVLVRPKNYVAREVPLLPDVVAQLREHLAGDGTNPHGLVWHRPNGAPLSNLDDNNALREALVRAGIDRPEATTHWLRHSYTTLAEHAGIPHAAYAGVSGHSSEQASDPYRHPLTAEGRRAVDALMAWLAN